LTQIAIDEHARSLDKTNEAPDLGVVMPPSEQSDTAEAQVLKIVTHQVLDKRSYKADALRSTLKKRASKPGSAKYRGNLSVDTNSIEENDEGEHVRFDLTVLRCKQCGQAHGNAWREQHQPRVIEILAVCILTAAYGRSVGPTLPMTSMIFIANHTVGEGLSSVQVWVTNESSRLSVWPDGF
jgi:hypothetical protein